MDRDEDIDNSFEAMLLNEQLSEGTIEQRLAEFGLRIEEALLVRQFQETRKLRFFLPYVRFSSKAKKYFLKYGDYFKFR